MVLIKQTQLHRLFSTVFFVCMWTVQQRLFNPPCSSFLIMNETVVVFTEVMLFLTKKQKKVTIDLQNKSTALSKMPTT